MIFHPLSTSCAGRDLVIDLGIRLGNSLTFNEFEEWFDFV